VNYVHCDKHFRGPISRGEQSKEAYGVRSLKVESKKLKVKSFKTLDFLLLAFRLLTCALRARQEVSIGMVGIDPQGSKFKGKWWMPRLEKAMKDVA